MRPSLFWMCLLAATTAAAQVRRLTVVSVARTDESSVAALEHQKSLNEALRADERFEFVEVAMRGSPSDQRKNALTALAAVEEFIASVDYPAARARAEKALAELQTADFREVGASYVELLQQLARVKFALNADDRGATELMLAFSLNAQAQPLRGLNREEKKMFDDQQMVVAARPRAGAVQFTAELPGWVWVDGQYRGVTPLKVSDLSSGRHFFTFVVPGGEPSLSSELLGTVSTVKLTPKIETRGKELRALVASLRGAGTPDVSARQLRVWSEVDELFVVLFNAAEAPLVVRANATQLFKKQAKSTTDADIVATVRELLEQQVPLVSNVEPPPPPVLTEPVVTEPAAPQKNRAPGIVIVSVGAAAAAVGGILLGVAQGQADAANRIPQVESPVLGQGPYHEQIAAANSTQTGGLIALGAGLLTLGVGIAVAW